VNAGFLVDFRFDPAASRLSDTYCALPFIAKQLAARFFPWHRFAELTLDPSVFSESSHL
jgi:hypothetical protein